MPGNVFVKILDVNGEKEAIIDYDFVEYTPVINGIGVFRIVLKKSNSYDFTKYVDYELVNDSGNEQGVVFFYKGTRLEFKGKVDKIFNDSSGRMVLSGTGIEGFSVQDAVTNGTRSSESPAVRATALLGMSSKLTAGTLTFSEYNSTATSGGVGTLTDTGATWTVNEWAVYSILIVSGTGTGQVRFIASNTPTVITITTGWATQPDNTSVYNIGNVGSKYYNEEKVYTGLKDLVIKRKNNEYFIDYKDGSTDEFEVRTRVGSSTSTLLIVAGQDFKFLSKNKIGGTGIINTVTVQGRFSGQNNTFYTGSYADGDDADTDGSSITKYGVRTPLIPVRDMSCKNSFDCAAKAKIMVLNYRLPRQVFTVNELINVDLVSENPDTSPRTASTFALGDKITATDVRSNLESASLRIVGFTRSIDGRRTERLSFITTVEGFKYVSSKEIRQNYSLTMRDGIDIVGNATTDAHLHADGTYNADSHLHTSDTFITANHGHGATGLTNTNSGGSSIITSYGSNSTNLSIANNTWSTAFSFGTISGTDLQLFLCGCDFFPLNYGGTCYWRLNVNSGTYYPSSTGILCACSSNFWKYVTLMCPVDISGLSVVLEVKWVHGQGSNQSLTIDTHYTSNAEHTHTISGTSANNNPAVSGNSTNTNPGVTGNSSTTSPTTPSSGLYGAGS